MNRGATSLFSQIGRLYSQGAGIPRLPCGWPEDPLIRLILWGSERAAGCVSPLDANIPAQAD